MYDPIFCLPHAKLRVSGVDGTVAVDIARVPGLNGLVACAPNQSKIVDIDGSVPIDIAAPRGLVPKVDALDYIFLRERNDVRIRWESIRTTPLTGL